MKQALRVRTLILLLFGLAVANSVILGVYTIGQVRRVQAMLSGTTTTMRRLFGEMADDQRWTVHAFAAAERAVAARDAGADELRLALRDRDRLVGRLPLAEVPPSVRLPFGRAADLVNHLVVALDEIRTLLELGRFDAARARLAEANRQREQLQAIESQAELAGLEDISKLDDRLAAATASIWRGFADWLVGSLLLVLGATYLFHRRVNRPLAALRGAFERVAAGDLTVSLPVVRRDELGELQEHFNRVTRVLNDRAERQGQTAAAAELLANVAHEVNNPLMAITGTAHERLADPGLPAVVRTDLETIEAQAHRAGKLVQGIVRLVRPAPGGSEPVALNDVVQAAWDLVSHQLRADGVEGTLELSPEQPAVVADAHRLEHVILNLLVNARQAVLRGGSRRIIARTLVEDGVAIAEIRDSGPGVPIHQVEHLFKPFHSAEGKIGLGLYTSRNIARVFGGDVVFQPVNGDGAAFRVRLPRVPTAPTFAPPAPARPTAGRMTLAGVRILLVDDEEPVRRPIARYLQRRGAVVREAGSGREALAAVTASEPDVIITDLRMPDLDGVGLYRELVQRRLVLARRVLFLSGDVAQLEDLGATGVDPERVLTKPLEMAELERHILAHLAAVLPVA